MHHLRDAAKHRAGADIDDLAVAARLHVRHDVLGHQERAAHVHRHDAIPHRDVDLGEVLLLERGIDRRVVDQDVDLAEPLHGLGDQRLHLALVADVEGHAGGGVAAVLGGELGGERAAVGNVGDHHLGAFGRERLRSNGARCPWRRR